MKAKTATKLKQEALDRYENGEISAFELKRAQFHLAELVRNTPLMER